MARENVHDNPMPVPYRPIARHIILSAVVIWLGLRFCAAAAGWGLNTSISLAIVMVVLSTALSVSDARLRNRRLLLENLGISRAQVALLAGIPPVVFESLWLLWGGR
jgi:hypothetical protein